MATYHDPQNVTLGGTGLSGVSEIHYGVEAEPLVAAGDGQTHASVIARGGAVCRGEIAFGDPVQARAAVGRSGTLTARLKGIAGAADKTLTIRGVRIMAEHARVPRAAAAGGTVRFVAAADDGTDPVSLT
jgi:hypothetical protein